jgi:hypothetical protein
MDSFRLAWSYPLSFISPPCHSRYVLSDSIEFELPELFGDPCAILIGNFDGGKLHLASYQWRTVRVFAVDTVPSTRAIVGPSAVALWALHVFGGHFSLPSKTSTAMTTKKMKRAHPAIRQNVTGNTAYTKYSEHSIPSTPQNAKVLINRTVDMHANMHSKRPSFLNVNVIDCSFLG